MKNYWDVQQPSCYTKSSLGNAAAKLLHSIPGLLYYILAQGATNEFCHRRTEIRVSVAESTSVEVGGIEPPSKEFTTKHLQV